MRRSKPSTAIDVSFTDTGQDNSSIGAPLDSKMKLNDLIQLRDMLIKQNEDLRLEVDQMAERANQREFDYGYDDSLDGDLLRDIESKIQFLQENNDEPANFIRSSDEEGRMTANAALYGPNDLSGISGMIRAE